MKKIYRLFGFAAAAAMLFTGCAKDATEDVAAPDEKTFTLVIVPEETVEALTDDGTRTYWDEESENVKWSENEYFWCLMKNVYRLVQFNNGKFNCTYDAGYFKEGDFVAGELLLTGIVPEDYGKYRNITDYSQAPNKVVLALPSAQESTGTSFDPWLDVLVGSKYITITEEEVEKGHAESGMPFARVMAITKYIFTVDNPDLSDDETVESVTLTVIPGEGHDPIYLTGSYNLDISAIPAKVVDDNGEQVNLRTPFRSGSPSVSTTYPADAQPKLGELVFWPITAPVKLEAGDVLQFRIVTDKHEITKEITLTKELYYANHKMNRATVKLDGDTNVHSFDEAIDLSADGTANSYIVNKPRSTYKFRADVKGNDTAQTIDPKSAVVLWYNCVQTNGENWLMDSPVELESVKLTDDNCIEFSTPETFVNGNVVIAALDTEISSDDLTAADRQLTNAHILWSWNLIVSDGYDIDDATQTVTKGGYTFMTRDLGAVIDKDKYPSNYEYIISYTQGNIYQWGRKDPFPEYTSDRGYYASWYQAWFTPTYTPIIALQQNDLKTGYMSTYYQEQIFGISRETVAYDFNVSNPTTQDDAEHIAFGVENPHIWLNNEGGSNGWIAKYESAKDMWGGESGTKSIYDPCPAGWKVPSKEAWTALIGTDDEGQLNSAVAVNSTYFGLDGVYFFPIEGRNAYGEISGNLRANGYGANADYYCSDVNVSGETGRSAYLRLSGPSNYSAGSEVSISFNEESTSVGKRIRCVKE